MRPSRRMAADLDHRSPDASQWGVGSSGVVVGVGARDAGGATGGGGGGVGARVCSARGGVGSSGGGGRCWPGRGAGRGRAGASTAPTTSGVAPARGDIWGASPTSCTAAGGGCLESTEPKGESSSRGSCAGTGCGDQQSTPGSRERRRRERGACTASGSSQQRKGRGVSGVSGDQRSKGAKKAPRAVAEEQSQRKGGCGAETRGKKAAGAVGPASSNAEDGHMDTDSAYGGNVGHSGSAQSSTDALRVGAGGEGREANVVAPTGRVGLEENCEADGGGESEMEATHVCPRPSTSRLAYKLSVSLIDTYKLINQR